MPSFQKALLPAAGGLLFWVADAFFYSSYNSGVAFASAMWLGVSPLHFVLRLMIAALLLFLTFLRVHAFLKGRRPAQPLREIGSGNELFFGSAESQSQNRRLLYHALRLAAYFKLPAGERSALRTLCYCYDIGKVGVPYNVLENPRLNEEARRRKYESHVALGAEILAAIPELSAAANLVLHHHEYFNGGGYLGINGRHIPLPCRIFQVAWAYDCMVYPAGRSKAFLCDDALLELRYYSGTAFDPEVVEAFIKLMSRHSILAGLEKRAFSLR
ncbi:MAG: HD domain-containing protein [Clostridiales bacterium]|nr:HD domain-containing protein [Clostridiales bacterium]